MDVEQQDSFLARSISEHFSTQKTNPVLLPVEHIKLDVSDTRNTLWRLKDTGVIKSYKHCWGFFEIEKRLKRFVITSREEPKTDEDVEVYEIEIVPGRLAQMAKGHSTTSQPNDSVILHLNKDGDLYKDPREKFTHEMKGSGIPLKILRYFIDNPNTDYEETTETMALNIGMKAEQLRKEIGKMRSKIKSNLKLSSPLIEARQNSGYRLNPKVEIVLD